MKIAEYFASAGVRIDKGSFTRFDNELNKLEARLRRFSQKFNTPIKFSIDSFDVNDAKLKLALGNALDMASPKVAFEISKFVVNDRNLQAALLRAARRLPLPPPGPNPPGGGPHPPYPPHPGPYPPPRPGPSPSGSRRGMGGFYYGGLGGFYGPALALGLGGYGLSELNKRNQEVVSAQLQSQAVVQQALGDKYTPEQGKASFEWLRKQADRIGFNYLDASADYNKLLSGLTGAGMTIGQGQDVYKGFAEYSRVNKLDRVQQQRVFRALSQIAGKNKLQAEELTGQLAESLPGAVAIFAQAYQNQLAAEGKGGGKTGQEAISQLYDAMKKGQVKGNILTYAGSLASAKAEPGLAAARVASQAEQQRYQNSVSDLAVIASQAGVEEGFARIFRTLNNGLKESGDLVQAFGEAFNDATKYMDDLLLWPQSFMRALEGRDSVVADWLGKDSVASLIADWNQIKAIWQEISQFKTPEWMPTLEATTRELAALIEKVAKIKGIFDQGKAIAQTEYQQDPSVFGQIKGLAKSNWFTFSSTMSALNPFNADQAKANWDYWTGNSPTAEVPKTQNQFTNFDDSASQSAFEMDMLNAQQEDKRVEDLKLANSFAFQNYANSLSATQFDYSSAWNSLSLDKPKSIQQSIEEDARSAAMNSTTNNNTQTNNIEVNVTVNNPEGTQATDPQQLQILANAVADELTKSLESVQINAGTTKE